MSWLAMETEEELVTVRVVLAAKFRVVPVKVSPPPLLAARVVLALRSMAPAKVEVPAALMASIFLVPEDPARTLIALAIVIPDPPSARVALSLPQVSPRFCVPVPAPLLAVTIVVPLMR